MKSDTPTTQADVLLADLTPPQQQAVAHVDGPLLVLAGAGSGKTRVITRRIAHLVLRVGVAPWNVLAITFTNKAAGEMRSRMEHLLSPRQAKAVTVCTFHSLCARLVREFADRLNLPRAYSIYGTADQTRAMKQALEALKIGTSNFPPGRVLSTISNAKNQLLGPDAYAASVTDFYGRTVGQLYKKYQSILTKNAAVDFDDLLWRTVVLLQEHDDVLAQLRDRYRYLLIDEYQDTNHAQFTLAHTLSAGHGNLCATGDPDQSIYGWRGADISNILEFESRYPSVTTVRLEQNYRSTKSILAVADQLIRQNTRRKHKALWTENDTGEPIQAVTCYDERHEAQWVIDWFTQLHNRHEIPWGSMAVFYRVNSLSRAVEDAFRTAHIPYQIARGTSFYERKEIKDAIAYLRVVANPADEINLLRIINNPSRGISANTVRSLQAHAATRGFGLAAALGEPADVRSLNTRAVTAVDRFAKMLGAWRAEAGSGRHADVAGATLCGLVERVLQESGLQEHFRNDRSDPDQERLMNLGELVNSAQQFEEAFELSQMDGDEVGEPAGVAEKLEAYLEQISLVSDVDAIDDHQGAVTLMTLHAAKGLEFPAVAMIGLEDGLLPHGESSSDPKKLEEERRLCFVGITRAQHRLAFTNTRYRTIFGRVQPAVGSRFLGEMPEDYVSQEDRSFEGAGLVEEEDRSVVQLDQPGSSEKRHRDGFAPGTLVRHPQFGLGRVVEVRYGGSQTRARVDFNTAGAKTLVLQYARLEKVSV